MLAPHLLLPGHTLVTAPKLLGRGGSRLDGAQSKPTRLPCCGSTPDAKLYLHCIRNSYLTLIRSLPEICIRQDHSLREEMRGRMVKLINGYKVEPLREAGRNGLSLEKRRLKVDLTTLQDHAYWIISRIMALISMARKRGKELN